MSTLFGKNADSSPVGFARVSNTNNFHQLKQTILDSLDLIHCQLPKDIQNIVIKPNMCYYWDHSTGQTTAPKFVAAIIHTIRDRISQDVNISVVESDASAMKCKYALKFLGYEKMAKNHGVRLVNLSEDKSEEVIVTVENQRFHFRMPQTIKNADLRINIPKVKYLDHTKISCALKNIFGCNPDPNKFKYHRKLDEAIVALNKIMKFNLCILDGLIVSGSQSRRLGLIMTSQDPVALDAAASRIAGINPKTVRHIMLASKEGIGNTLFIPKGADPKFFEKRYPRRGLKDKVLFSAYKLATRAGLLDAEML